MDKNDIKIVAFEEEIFNAIKEGSFERKKSAFRLKAVELGLSKEDLAILIDGAQKRYGQSQSTMTVISEKKTSIFVVILVLWALEWYFGMKGSWGVLLILLVNFVSAFAVVMAFAAWVNKKIKK